jgi:hypothetical protein
LESGIGQQHRGGVRKEVDRLPGKEIRFTDNALIVPLNHVVIVEIDFAWSFGGRIGSELSQES